MNLNTRSEDFKPDKVTYTIQYGLTYYWKKYFFEGFVSNQVRLDSNIFRGPTERSNLLGLRAGTKGMKPGYYDFGISFNNQQNFQWLNNWQGQASVAHYFQNQDWPYLWDFEAKVRWDVCRLYFAIPYVQSDINWRIGSSSTKDSFEYAIEPGVRFHGIFDLAIYYRFQHLNNNLIFPGPYQNQNLIGIKVLF